MKRCPACQSTYADDSLRFCLQDGATLESASVSDDFKTLVLPEGASVGRELPPTEVLDMGASVTAHQQHQPSPTSPHRPRDTNPTTGRALTNQPATRNTAAVVGLTVVATIALLALGGLTAWLLLRDKTDSAQRTDSNVNVNVTRTPDNQNNALPNSNTRPSTNSNISAVPSPTATPTPASTPKPLNPSGEEGQVRAALNNWLTSFRAHDINAYMANYANVLEAYYLARNVGVARVRADKERAFAKYSTIEVWLSNISVEVDASGKRAVTTFNKSWRFTGDGVNPYTGSGLNQFTWTKIGGQWLITGEEDLSH